MPLAVILPAGMILIILSADYFTNGVEWLGFSWGLGEGVVGSLLAALGTALPETLVPAVAIMARSQVPGQGAIGLGAILGAPLMLSTLGFSIIGLGLWTSGRRRDGLRLGDASTRRDLGFFVVAFFLAVVAGWLPTGVHRWVALVLVGGYVVHAVRLVRASGQEGREGPRSPEQPLHLFHGSHPPLFLQVFQVGLALFGLIVGAHFFVAALDHLSHRVRIPGFLLSVVITPVATELPEVLNSIIWIRRGRDGLALGNVTGAMAFQASLVPALGLVWTPWRLSGWELVTAATALTAAIWLWVRSGDRVLQFNELMFAGLLYLAFIILIAAQI